MAVLDRCGEDAAPVHVTHAPPTELLGHLTDQTLTVHDAKLLSFRTLHTPS